MSDKQDVTISISADASGVEAGVAKTKKSLKTLGGSANEMAGQMEAGGKRAAAGIESIGTSSTKTAKEIERATKTAARELQRQIAELNAGGKATREYAEALARLRGADLTSLRPLLDELDLARKKAEEAKKGAEGFAGGLLSIKTAAAGLAVSLTVGAVFSRFIAESKAAEKEQAQLAAVLRSTGEAAGWSQAQLNAMADAMSSKSTFSAGAINEAQTRLLSYTNIVGKEFPRAMQAVIDMSARMGMDVKSSAETIGRALDIPSEGLTALTRQGFRFTEDQKALVKALEETGRAGEAQAIILDALESSYGGAAEAARNTFGGALEAVQNTLGSLLTADGASMGALTSSVNDLNSLLQADSTKQAFAFYVDLMISGASAATRFAKALADLKSGGFGAFLGHATADNASSELVSVESKLSQLRQSRDSLSRNTLKRLYNADDILIAEKQIAMLEKQREVLLDYVNQGIAGYEQMGDAAEHFAAQQEKAVGAPKFDGLVASVLDATKSFKSKSEQMAEVREQGDKLRAALKKLEENEQGASKEADQLRERLKGVDERLAAMAKSGAAGATGIKTTENAIKSFIKSLEAKTAAQRLEIAQDEKLTESQRARIQLEALLADSKNKASKSQVANAQALLAESEANEAWLKNASDVEKALADMQKAREQSLQSVQDSVKKLVEEAEAAAYAETHNISLAEAVERLALARAENAYQQAVERQEAPATLAALEAELQARKKIVELTAQKGVKEANKKAAEQAAKDWEKVSQTIGDTLADYIMGGGKNAAQYLKRLFATLVLQPVVQTVVGGLMGTGVAGASGVASGGVGGVGGLVNSASNLYSMFNSPLLSTNIAAGLSSQIGTLGADLWMNGFESVGNSLIEFSSSIAGAASTINMIGNGLGYVSAIYSLSQGKYGSAIGAGIGTYVGGPIGAVIGSTLGGLVDGLFGGGTVHTGAAGVYTGGKVQASNASTARQPWIDVAYSPGMQASIDSVAGLIGGSLDAIATQLGKKSGYSVKIGYGADNDDPSFGAYNITNPTGNKLAQYGWATKDFRFDSDPSKGYDEYLKSISKKTLDLMVSEFGGWAGDIAASVSSSIDQASGQDAIKALQTTTQQILAVVSGFKALGEQMDMFAGLTTSVQSVLIKVSGSFDALASNAQSFYANYYSEQERLDATVAGLTATFAKYGAALPATTEQYRALVAQQMAAGEAGAEFAAVLLGLNGTFKQVADAWKAELDGMRESVSGVFDGLTQGISDLAADVASDRASILRSDRVMTAQEIALAIAGTAVATPSTAQVDAAKAAEYAALAGVNAAKLVADSAGARSSSAYSSLQKANSDAGSVSAQIEALNAAIAERESNRSRRGRAAREAGTAVIRNQRDALAAQLYSMQQEIARLGVAANDAAAQYAAATEQLDGAKQRLEQAQALRDKAMADYAVSTKAMIDDAAKSVTKLSDLRGEVSSFYEAQAQAVQTMLQSAGNLRSVVDEQLRLGQLDSAQTAAELSSRYAANYSMALATSGSTRAGYVDAMAGSLPALTDALKAQAVTGEDWRIQTAKLFAQATTAAALLDGDAKASDYQEVALGLLDSIDSALSELGSAAQSAQDLIVSAIEQGTASNLVGLRAVIAALKGDPIPAFAAGGFHVGGLRLVGERGPELEATGPARIWTASQTAAMLGGGGSNAAVLAEIKALRDDNRRLGAENLRMQQRFTKLIERWEVEGMPSTRQEVVA